MAYPIADYLQIKTATALDISRDGKQVLVGSNLTGTMQLYSVAATGGELVQLTDEPEPVSGAFMPASDEILLTKDDGGNERHQIYLMDKNGGPLRPVVHDPEYIHGPGGVTRDGKVLAFTSNRRNGVDFDVYIHDLATAEQKLVFDMGGWCEAAGFSPDGRYLSVVRLTDRSGDNDLYLLDLQTEEVIHVSPHDDEASFGIPRWLPDSSAFYFDTDTEREFDAIAKYDMGERSWKIVLEDGSHGLGCRIDWEGNRLLVSRNVDGYTEFESFDPRTLQSLGKMELPRPGIVSGTLSKDGSQFCYGFHSPVDPGDTWIHDFGTGETTRLTDVPKPIDQSEFIAPTVHRYPSFDGEQIPVFVFKPRDAEEPTPVVINIHGGPESQYMPIFNPVVQYLLHRGYAVAAPNVRGSTGYGKRYQHLDDVRKRLDSVKDLESLHAWLPTVGLDQKKAVLMGGSYGGYMTLAGLAFQPQLWAAGVDIVGISSLVTFLENTAAWRRKFREREYGSLEHDRDFLIEASPITKVDNISAPLFIIHGRNDPRVPVTEAEQIHAVLTSKGIPCDLLIYEDEGHGLAKLKNRLDAYPKAADFLDRVLGS